jgi:myo-inositol 2-dehydrogenase / D-chiro-inositol 1-dehydrogenase
MSRNDEQHPDGLSRRNFLKTATAAAVGGAVASGLEFVPGAYAAGSDEIRVGLIGCGGRGTGAARNVLASAQGVRIVAMGDTFKDRLDGSKKALTDKMGAQFQIAEDRCFVGLDAFEKVLATDANYIILATPPGFRPQHLKAAIAAGKNIFTEKPVAVDAPGIRLVMQLADEAASKKLAIVAGTQRRHQAGYLETLGRVHDGAIGDIVAARCYWNQGGLWHKDKQAEWSELEYQIRNWLYYTWLSGDHIVEQHVHNIDVINWALRGHPLRAVGMGGRQVRTGPEFGHIFDHFAIDYEYPNGVHVMSMARQIDGCENNVSEALVGTKGTCRTDAAASRYELTGANAWRRPKNDKDVDPYVQEHTDLIASIRAGKPLNELKQVAESVLTAIMGRMSTYSGKAVTWDEALASNESLVPDKLTWGPMPTPAVAMPGMVNSV